MDSQATAELMLSIFKAIEARDKRALTELFHPRVEFHWPPSLPYGGTRRLGAVGPTWEDTWDPLQPTPGERSMDAEVVASGDDRAVVLWNQKGLAADGSCVTSQVLGMYDIEDGKLIRAQMFYFNCEAVVRFLDHDARARVPQGRAR